MGSLTSKITGGETESRDPKHPVGEGNTAAAKQLESKSTSRKRRSSAKSSSPAHKATASVGTLKLVPSQAELERTKNNKLKRKGLETWYKRVNQLKAFKESSGHCCVPQKYEPNPQLGTWVMTQRAHKKKARLTKEQIKHLESLGFQWDGRRPPADSPRPKKRSRLD
jgi:hypothetical protein